MAVSVVGFDVGCLTSYVAVARGGGIETITNEYSERHTPTCVAFTDRQRLIGTSAKLQHVTNVRNTFVNFVPLLGKMFSDPAVAREQRYLSYKLEAGPDGRVRVRVTRGDGPSLFTPEQLMAMQLTKLRQVTESSLSRKVADVVINVPIYYTDAERRSVMDASRIAGLNCVKLVSDSTAIGTAYGLCKSDLPPVDQPPRYVVFVNIGYTSTQVALCAFNTGKMKVVSNAFDWQLGGRDLDYVIFHKLASEFQAKYGLKISDNPKAVVRLLQECEKVKKVMSANSQELPVNIECLMDDRDLCSRIKRADFEEWADEFFTRFEKLLRRCLSSSNVDIANIHSVEMVGGTSRVPRLKDIVSSVFGQDPRSTLNADEAVARGCALQAAICSPVFKVREFSVSEACPYGITLHWDRDDSGDQSMQLTTENDGEFTVGQETSMEVFPRFHSFPSSRRLFFNRRGPFILEARYTDPDTLPNQNVLIGTFRVSNPHQQSNELCRIRVKVRMDAMGIFSVSQAEVAEEYEKEVEVPDDLPQPGTPDDTATSDKPMEVETLGNGDATVECASDSKVDGKKPTLNNTTSSKISHPKKVIKKKAVRYKDLRVDSSVMQFSVDQVNEFCELEGKLFEQDELEHKRTHAKNAVEEYVYEMRNRLQNSLNQYATAGEQKVLMEALDNAEDWLYGDGEDLHRQAYVDRLNQMKLLGNPIETRATESESRTTAVRKFEQSLVHVRKVVDYATSGHQTYNHLTTEQIGQLQTNVSQYDKWLRDQLHAQNARRQTEDPILKSADITDQHKAFEAACHPIINTPKPAPPPPPPAPPQAEEQTACNNASNGANVPTTHDVPITKAQMNSETMDVD